MKKNRGFYASLSRFLGKTYSVWCDTPTPPDPEPTPNPDPNPDPTPAPAPAVINYEDLIAKARQEEKNKLYKQMEGLKTQVQDLTKKNNDNLLTIGQKDEEIRILRETSGKSESDVVKALNVRIKGLEDEVKKLEGNSVSREEIEKEVRSTVEAEYEVKLYRQEVISKAGNTLIPELVVGTTKEEIDASVVSSTARFTELFGSVQPNPDPNPNPEPTRPTPTVPIPNPPTSPSAKSKEEAIREIQNLDPNSPTFQSDYAELRKKLGLKPTRGR